MTLIPLYGYIPNPNKPHEGDPLYVLKEEKVSPALYKYRGFIGHGYHEEEFKPDDWTSDRITSDPDLPIKFIKYDMRDLIFIYNTESNLVTIETHWRFESYEEEAKSLAKNVETDAIVKDEDETSYPYFRYPRTKDGIAISRVFARLFKDKNVKVFASKEYLG